MYCTASGGVCSRDKMLTVLFRREVPLMLRANSRARRDRGCGNCPARSAKFTGSIFVETAWVPTISRRYVVTGRRQSRLRLGLKAAFPPIGPTNLVRLDDLIRLR